MAFAALDVTEPEAAEGSVEAQTSPGSASGTDASSVAAAYGALTHDGGAQYPERAPA